MRVPGTVVLEPAAATSPDSSQWLNASASPIAADAGSTRVPYGGEMCAVASRRDREIDR